MGRKYVHLSESLEFAILAGKRRGKLVILEVDTEKALANQVKFYKANHGVWLTNLIDGMIRLVFLILPVLL